MNAANKNHAALERENQLWKTAVKNLTTEQIYKLIDAEQSLKDRDFTPELQFIGIDALAATYDCDLTPKSWSDKTRVLLRERAAEQ